MRCCTAIHPEAVERYNGAKQASSRAIQPLSLRLSMASQTHPRQTHIVEYAASPNANAAPSSTPRILKTETTVWSTVPHYTSRTKVAITLGPTACAYADILAAMVAASCDQAGTYTARRWGRDGRMGSPHCLHGACNSLGWLVTVGEVDWQRYS